MLESDDCKYLHLHLECMHFVNTITHSKIRTAAQVRNEKCQVQLQSSFLHTAVLKRVVIQMCHWYILSHKH